MDPKADLPSPSLVVERWPVLAGELRAALLTADEIELADQVVELVVVQPCSCDEDFCQSFYTAPPPDGPYGPGHENVVLDPPWSGELVLDLLDDRIRYVEVLFRRPLD